MSLSNKKSGGQLFDLLFFWLWALFILAPLRRDLAGDFIIMLCVCVSSQLDRLYSTDPFKFKLALSIWFRYSLPFEQKIGTKFRFRYNLNIEVKWQKWRNWDPHCPVSSVQCHSGGLNSVTFAIWDENWRRYVRCIAGIIIPQMAKCQNIRKVKLYHHSARPLEPGLCQEHLYSQPNDFWLWVMSPPWIKTENTLGWKPKIEYGSGQFLSFLTWTWPGPGPELDNIDAKVKRRFMCSFNICINNCLCLKVYHFFPQLRSIEKLPPFPKFPDNEVCLLPSLPAKFKEGRFSLNFHWNLIKVHQTEIRAEIKLHRAKSEPIMFYVKLSTPNVYINYANDKIKGTHSTVWLWNIKLIETYFLIQRWEHDGSV